MGRFTPKLRDCCGKWFGRTAACAILVAGIMALTLDPGRVLARAAGLPTHDRVLSLAVVYGDIDRALDALDAGASPNARSEAGYPVLSLAVESGDVTLVRALLARGADSNALAPCGWSPLDFAIMNHANGEVVDVLTAAGATRQVRARSR
jgi:hypothetical protein